MCIEKKDKILCAAAWLLIVCYFAAICFINFSRENFLVMDTDMYCDFQYAKNAWSQKSLFPEGWVFGNQYYVAATPVLAALLQGIAGDPILAMGIASTIMAAAVLLSFSWMLMPVSRSVRFHGFAILFFLSFSLYCGDPISSLHGWQVTFTMCSYYACYYIASFLAFGIYLRADDFRRNDWIMLAVAGAMSFAMGMHSLRQTVVMIVPLLAVEACRMLLRLVRKQTLLSRSARIAAVLTVLNVMGILTIRQLHPANQVNYGELTLQFSGITLSNILDHISMTVAMICRNGLRSRIVLPVLAAALCYLFWNRRLYRQERSVVCLLLYVTSIGALLAVGLVSTICMRDIYYYLLIPMIALIVAWLLLHGHRWVRCTLSVAVVVLSALILIRAAWGENGFTRRNDTNIMGPVSDYLLEQKVDTVYTPWNLGERIAAASDFQIQAGFVHGLEPARYLCNPQVFEADASRVVYAFLGGWQLDGAMNSDLSHLLTLEKYFPEQNVWVYTAEDNLMKKSYWP